MSGFNDLFKAMGSLLDLAKQMEDAGQSEVTKTGSFSKNLGNTEPLQGVYGFTLKLGQGEASKVKTFGNMRPGADQVEVGAWEPLVDVFDEPGQVVITAELPGVSRDQVKVTLEEGILHLHAAGDHRLYAKDFSLPCGVKAEELKFSCRNGILEVVIPKM